jgi:hypothetical protein
MKEAALVGAREPEHDDAGARAPIFRQSEGVCWCMGCVAAFRALCAAPPQTSALTVALRAAVHD